MSAPPDNQPADKWQRKHWRPIDERPFVFFVIYGLVDVPEVDARRYCTRGVPADVEARVFDRERNADYLQESFEAGYAWETLRAADPELAAAVSASPGAIAFAGDVSESSSLAYLRDLLGMTACLLDHGALGVYDPFTFRWWRPDAWREKFFSRDEPSPKDHVMIYFSEESDGVWLHTRGLLTFGRPDLSVRGVHRRDFDAAAGMCNEIIELQAFGVVLNEGQVVRHPVLGPFRVEYAGDRDDPEFNNIHIELRRQ